MRALRLLESRAFRSGTVLPPGQQFRPGGDGPTSGDVEKASSAPSLV